MKGAVAILMLWLAATPTARADTSSTVETNAYQVTGYYNVTNYTAVGAVRQNFGAAFLVAVEDEKLFLRLDSVPNSYSEWGFDGTNWYGVGDGVDVEMRPMARAAASPATSAIS